MRKFVCVLPPVQISALVIAQFSAEYR